MVLSGWLWQLLLPFLRSLPCPRSYPVSSTAIQWVEWALDISHLRALKPSISAILTATTSFLSTKVAGNSGCDFANCIQNMTTSKQQLNGPRECPLLENCSESDVLKSHLRPFLTKIIYYSDEIIFAALVHTVLDSLGYQFDPGISLVPRAPVCIAVCHLPIICHCSNLD